ncbi:MAG TPA: MGMT family protein [Syntrophales bacterium]|nr:MGMT family protein [Syntrophales bacterium]HOD97539.1 MGMT family protein [Syntrophales bacterium]
MVASWKYESVPSPWGEVAVVWRVGGEEGGVKVAAIILPSEKNGPEGVWKRRFPGIVRENSPAIRLFCADLQRALKGQAVRFSLDLLDMAFCTDFEKKVLAACFRIPQGAVISYGALAERVGSPRGARAVGRVMAGNPFPIVIPCHRVVRGDGTLGGYGGGLAMKKVLLAWEGIQVPAPRGRSQG